MPANLNLRRLSLRKKSVLEFTIPTVPMPAEWFIKKFGLEQWRDEMVRWREVVQTQIKEQLLAIRED